MPIFRTIVDKVITGLVCRDEYQSVMLRRYFERTYGIKVGLYTLGAFDRWRIPPNSTIGRYSSIAHTARLIDANHPIDALSTHPYFYLKGFGTVDADRAKIQPPVVEDDVWLGHNCIITPSCQRIGRGAVVGAGAVVMSNVPPYAIMTGAPAKLVRYRFAPEVIVAIEATEWWTLDKPSLDAALRMAPGFSTAPTRENANLFLRAIGRPELPAVARAAPDTIVRDLASPLSGGGDAVELLQREIAHLTAEDMHRPLADLEVDSFGLISLRLALEARLGRQISDRTWGAVQTPADILRIAHQPAAAMDRARPSVPPAVSSAAPEEMAPEAPNRLDGPASERRIQYVNMPQMAMSGLSEPWTFKEIGDLHWSVLTRGLRTPSAAVADSEGDRLYATFTRICLVADQPLTDIAENDRLTLDLEMSRFGAGMFFSSAQITGVSSAIRAQVMTSFSKFGEAGSNTSLLKGQPVIPDNCEIASLPSLPSFAEVYRAQRAKTLPDPIFECEYEILPPHDINGVGLLYFAAYPTIIDICASKRLGREMFSDFSTTHRDVYYFANCGPSETLLFRLHSLEEGADMLRFEATLSRKSDGKVMAFVATEKTAVKRAAAPGPQASAVAITPMAAKAPPVS
jgi:virginiamycin A acetyltransferase